LEKSVSKEPEEDPPPKEFIPKNPNLTILEDYPSVLGREYWDVWEGNDYKPTEGSMIDHVKLLEVADRLELKEKAKGTCVISQCHRVMLSGGPVQRRGPF
jgi:hypothetical protein